MNIYNDFVSELAPRLDTQSLGRLAVASSSNAKDTVKERQSRKKRQSLDCLAYHLSKTFHEPRKRLQLLAILYCKGDGIDVAKADSSKCFQREKKPILIPTRAAIVARMFLRVQKLNCNSHDAISKLGAQY